MSRDRKCILCETVHASKQEMDEHMRSMLHHRELEKLKGRDCGHECRVCKVTLASLTDYAGHISSATHKQNVEKSQVQDGHDEDYFNPALVDLVEKRKEQSRKEEAAAAKLAKEEGERRKREEFQQRLKEAKEHFQLECGWRPPSDRPRQHKSWYNGRQDGVRAGEPQPWHQGNQGKSATWHAQAPPGFQRWPSGDLHDRSFNSQECWGNPGSFSGGSQGRLPWVSRGGSNYGVYGRNNVSHFPPRNGPLRFWGPPAMYPRPPHFFSGAANSNNSAHPYGQRPGGICNGEDHNPEGDHKNSKTLGSNPKLDKSCRWSPYPVSKGFDSALHKDTAPEKFPKKQDKTPESSASGRQSRPEQRNDQLASGAECAGKKGKSKKNPKGKSRDRSSSGSRSGSAQNDKMTSTAHANVKAAVPLPQDARKVPSAQVGKASGHVLSQSKSTAPGGGKAPSVGPLQSRQGQKLPETSKKDVGGVLDKSSSLNTSGSGRLEEAWQSVEERLKDQAQNQAAGGNKENTCRQNAAKPSLPDSGGSSSSRDGKEKPSPCSDGSRFLQSLHVSTSAAGPAASGRAEAGTEAAGAAEAARAGEAPLGSESDACRSDEANVSGRSKLSLPSALKRDLTKHMVSKGKAGAREPNLNIARRVRNLSESRRSDSEKDSGLKPTVRQLISSSASRRTVNWEQVYQEVRKKQDKAKGLPRFGIEMVPLEQEDQSQEEDDVPLLEGFQWESLMDSSSPAASRKRSLSESSIAPASARSQYPARASEETQQSQSSGPQRSSPPPKTIAAKDKAMPCRQDVEQILGRAAIKSEVQPVGGAPEAPKAVRRPDSALGDSSSGTEQLDGQGAGKRRRAAGDAQSPEASGLEHDNKRRKIRSKRERLHIDKLLAVSLREEELSRSLQTVDTSLVQARAALQAAYMEVQRFMAVKEQITAEMSTLRNRRIELLKGMQGTLEMPSAVELKEEKMDSPEAERHAPSSLTSSSVPDAAGEAGLGERVGCASPLSSPATAYKPVAIKEEPQSPIMVSSASDAGDNNASAAAPPTDLADPTLDLKPFCVRKCDFYQAPGEPAGCKESRSGPLQKTEVTVRATRNCASPPSDSQIPPKLSASRRSSAVGGLAESSGPRSTEAPSVQNAPSSPPELRGGKRVRKLKKRKVLNKAQGTARPESSDTELDAETSRPRWLRPRRRPSGGSQSGGASSPPREDDEAAEEHRRASLQKAGPEELTGSLDSEECMEVTATCRQAARIPNTSRQEPHNLACNEVTSTSDMDVCKSSGSEMPTPVTTKTSSGAYSDRFEDDVPSEGVFQGHQEAVNAMQIHNGLLYTCSGDRTVKAFDLVSRKCVAVFEGHSSKVSCLWVSAAPCPHFRLYTGSSDQTVRCYNLKTQEFEQQFSVPDRVLCFHSRWKFLYAGLANGTVVTFNLKTNKQTEVFECHGPRAVSCLASTQEGSRKILLVGSYDNTISVRDAKNGLLLRTLGGHTKSVLCMKVVNDLVFSGSSDQCVYAHNIHSGELLWVYKGHSHAVTVVTVLGKVMVTACLDKLVRVHDLQSREQLQVYGGHKDMVMCMAVHRSMIYTGCYDGSVQAVKLNLMQNYCCRWHGCSMVLGVMEHLQQHLLHDHVASNFQTLRCRWRDCEEVFSARNSSKQALLLHMQQHAEEEALLEP